MITLLKVPAVNRVLLDANNTDIQIQSSNGAGYYFRALIYVDDVLFDEQGWSRVDNFTATKNLKKLYNAYYESEFIPFSVNELVEKTNLIKKISISIQEKLISSDTLVDTIDLPDFYFMYNKSPVYFDDSTKLQLLGVQSSVLQIPENGKIIIPFFVRAEDEAITVELKDNFGEILNSQNIESFAGKKIFTYSFDLSGVNLASNTIYFEATITCGTTITTSQFRLIRLPDFPVKEFFFKNNFGYYIPIYLSGELEVSNAIKISDYQASDGQYYVSEINEELTYTINTSYLLEDERSVINQLITSYDVLFKVNNKYRRIQNATKKELQYRDKKHNYSQDLTFNFIPNGSVDNIYENSDTPDFDERDFDDNDFLT
jgi:hypothetical protein